MKLCKIQATTSNGSVATILEHVKDEETLKQDIAILKDKHTWVRKAKKKIKYCNYPISFDIETSSFYDYPDVKKVCMYIWQVAIGEHVYIGRTWEDWMEFNKLLIDELNLSLERRLVIYVHNLAYEFQFMRLYYDWEEVFAIKERDVLYACTTTGIEFRCSYLLSNDNLANIGSSLKRPIEKLKGDLDYKLLRGSNTPLTDEEYAYCINDVLIVTEYIREKIIQDGNITKIPLTKTGYVRRYCKNKCLYGDDPDKYAKIDAFMRYKKLMDRLTIDGEHEYLMLKRAFMGGFTHASIYFVGCKLYGEEAVQSQDITSSYPTCCIADLFPMSKGKQVHPKNPEEFDKYVSKYCCVFDIVIHNLQNTFINEAIIPAYKCWLKEGEKVNNGRLESAKKIGITITEQDYYTFAKFYSWDNIEVGDMYIYRRGYLPTPFIESILKFYQDKTVLKGLKDDQGHDLDEYNQMKSMLNSTYGMIVTDICRPQIEYDSGYWSYMVPDYEEKIEEYNKVRGRFLFYPWGVWVTAHARRNIMEAIYSIGMDYVYSDTDSVKYIYPEKHQAFFDDYNNRIVEKLKKAMRYHGLPEDAIEPKNQSEVPKPMGVFTDEGQYKIFKTLGAKRYMYTTDDGTFITVAGLGKEQGAEYINSQKDPYLFFTDQMYIPPEHTGKLTHTYIDETMEGTAKDYLGNDFTYRERSGVHLSDCDFTLSLSQEFIKMIGGLGIREEHQD